MPNITESQASQLRSFRTLDEKTRKRRKAALFAEIKSALRIPKDTRIKVEIDSVDSPYYCALKDAGTGELLHPISSRVGARQLKPVPAPVMDPGIQRVYDNIERAKVAVKPAPAGIDGYSNDFGRAPVNVARQVPILKLGSLALEDAASLLRIEGDSRPTFRLSEGEAESHAFVRDGRLYFVL